MTGSTVWLQIVLVVALVATLLGCRGNGLDRARKAHAAEDYATELTELEPLAAQGDATAQRYLAYIYMGGWGVDKDAVKAVDLLRRSADRGDLLSVYSLAGAYLEGLGVEKNEGEAVALYKRAAEGGNANAQVNLGSLYRFGRGVPEDLNEAVRWFRAAAQQGHPRAMEATEVDPPRGNARLGVDRSSTWRRT